MTILQGHFAILLVVSAPPGVSAEDLERALEPAAQRLDLVVAVRPLGEMATSDVDTAGSPTGTRGEPDETWALSIHGADRPGIVHQVATVLADAGANIVDLGTHLVGASAAPVYTMVLRVVLPGGSAGQGVADRIREAVGALGVHGTLHRDDADVL